MRVNEAYRTQHDATVPRVEVVLALYRKALLWLDQAHRAVEERRSDDARPVLAKAQLVIGSLAAGVASANDDVSANFLRLYEFASHCLSQGEADDIAAARNVLRTLMEGFEAVRGQAVALETQGQLPPLGRQHELQIVV